MSQLHQGFPATLCRCRSFPSDARDTPLRPGQERLDGCPRPDWTDLEERTGMAELTWWNDTPRPSAELAAQAADALAGATATEIVQWAADTFDDRLCLTSSMTDAVLIHLASL